MSERTIGRPFVVTARCPANHAWRATVRTERTLVHTGIGHRPSAASRKIVTPSECPACGERWAIAGGYRRKENHVQG